MNFKDYMTTGEAAAFLGISKQALAIWEKKGKLTPPIRNPLNGWRMYKKSDLQAILDQSLEPECKKLEIFPLDQMRKLAASLDNEAAQKSVERIVVVLEGIEKDIRAGIIRRST
jgi:DNA-binding transcriptional MerR regulator